MRIFSENWTLVSKSEKSISREVFLTQRLGIDPRISAPSMDFKVSKTPFSLLSFKIDFLGACLHTQFFGRLLQKCRFKDMDREETLSSRQLKMDRKI